MELLHAPGLNIFEPPLQRLILCGGGGLPAAYGPLVCVNGYTWTLDASGYALRIPAGGQEPIRSALAVLALPAMWTLPLDHWRARLALVAAWMLGAEEIRGASVYWSDTALLTCAWLVDGDRETLFWSADTGADLWNDEGRGLDLQTLPAHLADHQPAVALLLALYDVPEIRARLEGMTDAEQPAPGAL